MTNRTTSNRLAGCLVLAILTAGWGVEVPALDDSVAKAERERHQGTWIATSFVFDGTETPKDIVATITRTVEGDHVVWKRDGKNFAGTKFVLDPSKNPKTIDVTPDGGPNRDKVVLGIYKFEKDTLTICMAGTGQERPKTFEAEKGSGRTLMAFRRGAKTAAR